jgi:uncharacterized protein (DUF2384 family)
MDNAASYGLGPAVSDDLLATPAGTQLLEEMLSHMDYGVYC